MVPKVRTPTKTKKLPITPYNIGILVSNKTYMAAEDETKRGVMNVRENVIVLETFIKPFIINNQTSIKPTDNKTKMYINRTFF